MPCFAQNSALSRNSFDARNTPRPVASVRPCRTKRPHAYRSVNESKIRFASIYGWERFLTSIPPASIGFPVTTAAADRSSLPKSIVYVSFIQPISLVFVAHSQRCFYNLTLNTPWTFRRETAALSAMDLRLGAWMGGKKRRREREDKRKGLT